MTGADLPVPTGLPRHERNWHALTEDPRRYGLHATLKAPFLLAGGRSENALLDCAAAFASEQTAFEVSRLQVARIGPFVALVPAETCPPLDALAAASVRA